jgi:hypothetical protein
MITILLVAAAVMQQPQARQPVPVAAQVQQPGLQRTAAPKTAFDSTAAAVSDIGIKVSQMRSHYDVFRLAVFNGSDGAVAERAAQLGAQGRILADAVRRGGPALCRSCMGTRGIQVALDQYRATLGSVERIAQRLSTRMQVANARTPTEKETAALRRDVRVLGQQMNEGLHNYEMKLAALRTAMGWDVGQVPTPRRGN